MYRFYTNGHEVEGLALSVRLPCFWYLYEGLKVSRKFIYIHYTLAIQSKSKSPGQGQFKVCGFLCRLTGDR